MNYTIEGAPMPVVICNLEGGETMLTEKGAMSVSYTHLEGNFIYPRVVGHSIGLPGIWVLAAVIVGGGAFGIWGILFAVPQMCIRDRPTGT